MVGNDRCVRVQDYYGVVSDHVVSIKATEYTLMLIVYVERLYGACHLELKVG